MNSHVQLNAEGNFLRYIPAGIPIEWDENNYCTAFALEADGKAEQFRVSPFYSVAEPEYKPITHAIREVNPELVDGKWLQKWEVFALSEQDAQVKLAELLATKRTALTTEYERRMQAIAAGYPPSERESWPVQTSEATALIADPQAATPWIDAAATARGVDRLELANRIVAKDAMYRVISGTLSGVRQRIEDEIDAAGDDMAALQLINVAEGWR